MRTLGVHTALLLALVLAACGGEAGAPPPVAPNSAPAPSAEATPADGGAAVVGPAPTGTPVAPVAVEMKKSPVPSAMLGDLQALGLDAKNLPPIEKLDPKALRGVMRLMARSMGVKCGDCHQQGDFAAPTRRKKIAAKMWDEFAAKLTMGDGSPIFCDSCHQGRVIQLDRTDKKALSKWMDTNFVDGLKRKDGKGTECETCHVGMEMTFLVQWGQ